VNNGSCRDCRAHSGLVKEQEKNDIRFRMIERSIVVAKEEMDRRLDTMNHLQKKMDNLGTTLESKSEANIRYADFEKRIAHLEKQVWSGSGEIKWTNHLITVLIAMATLVAVWFITR